MRKRLPWLLLLCAVYVSAVEAENNFSFEGTFLTDDQVELIDFTLTSPETVTFQTWGYGGGTNAANTVISPDGFESLLTWFGSDGSYLGNSSTCGAGNTYQGGCLDAFGQVPLTAGTYVLALTQSGNFANCGSGVPGDLSCGFSEAGLGDYTPAENGNPNCTAFCGTFGTQETGNWAVDILNVSSASIPDSTPEPETMLLAVCCLAIMGFARHRSIEKRKIGERS